MSSQGVSRKRPAPGTSPAVHSLGALPNYNPNPGAQLSNDQFLQWGQNSAPSIANPSFPDTAPFNNLSAISSNQDIPPVSAPASGVPPVPSNQLARRQPTNQLVSRNRLFDQPAANFPDHGGGNGESGAWGETLEELYARALEAKKEAQAKRKQIPPFVQKLSSFLDESKNTELIRWSDDGNSFIVLDEDEFARRLIPELFKHNNYASFVRQLNMYGFHKKVGLSDNSMRASERKNKSPSEYANPYFKRGHPDLLWLIQKPKNTAGQGGKAGKGAIRVKAEDCDDNDGDDYGDDGVPVSQNERPRPRGQLSLVSGNLLPKEQLAGVYRELQAIRQQQQIISSTISKLRREHEQLYAQAANFQEQHTRHENSINAILTFLATVYNRSLQGQDGPQNLANSFAGAISQEQGNVVDIDDYTLGSLGAGMNSPAGQRTIKKQPLLLKAPPTVAAAAAPAAPATATTPTPSDRHGRATTMSPSVSSTTYDRSNHARQPSATTHTGHVEEVFDTSPRQQNYNNKSPPASTGVDSNGFPPQRDIMSVIQNSNARSGLPTTSFSDFPNVLSSLETSGGNVPLTPNQRADMLRLMANETGTVNPGGAAVSPNNALMTPTPPPMPQNYSGRLANTRLEIDNLVKMQAQQDRSVQNLTHLLQPLSPNGNIPGLGAGHAADPNLPPPPLDLDQIFNDDYFTDIADLEHNKNELDFAATSGHPTATSASNESVPLTTADDLAHPHNHNSSTHDLFHFDHIPDDGDLFDPSTGSQGGYFGLDGAGYNIEPTHPITTTNPATNINNNNHNTTTTTTTNGMLDSDRIVETLTDSESTSPANTVDESLHFPSAAHDDGPGSASKRRKQG
ncbi:hypothetical protein ASPZODRAFT_72335 [Penicilliopsis zonata CBS 506.65]|uniref:HSF-type DNA-binding domain-containing protein n=1 Tax=Penicilliopsis zonata CBS 506.65 TaxID=1073090 RepID=A0A1L9SA14_9EURO|nr:hypothetical protein ASPZODRAFT_72335 [Penicilliopsis zonata CBS 506.65]OJJ43989.1 hypothetical protein ASPZODRAFT_72335 [Penicilliopsis zonata CBS 506.65]